MGNVGAAADAGSERGPLFPLQPGISESAAGEARAAHFAPAEQSAHTYLHVSTRARGFSAQSLRFSSRWDALASRRSGPAASDGPRAQPAPAAEGRPGEPAARSPQPARGVGDGRAGEAPRQREDRSPSRGPRTGLGTCPAPRPPLPSASPPPAPLTEIAAARRRRRGRAAPARSRRGPGGWRGRRERAAPRP